MKTMQHRLCRSLAAFTLLAGSAWAQDFNGTTTSGPFSSGTHNFTNGAIFDANAQGASSGSATLNFHDSSQANVSATNAVIDGTLNFYENSQLNLSAAGGLGPNGSYKPNLVFSDHSVMNITGAGSVNAASLTFDPGTTLNAGGSLGGNANAIFIQGGATLNASAADVLTGNGAISVNGGVVGDPVGVVNLTAAAAISGGVLSVYNGSVVNALASNAITGGRQTFRDQLGGATTSSQLNAKAANAIAGGNQIFRYTSQLDASAENAISDGLQEFYEQTALNLTAANAITGGEQDVADNSVLNVTAAGAIAGGTQILLNESQLRIGVDGALTPRNVVYFDSEWGGSGGSLVLNGHSTAVGAIATVVAVTDGAVRNGAATASTLTVDTSIVGDSTFGSVMEDGGAGALALTKAGAGALTLTGTAKAYTGATTVSGGTLSVDAANVLSAASAVTVQTGGTLALLDNDQTIAGMNLAGGAVSLASPSNAPGTTLTVNGKWAGGNGGTVALDVALAGGGASTDRLVIDGGITGTTALKLLITGEGAQTSGDGIALVQTSGAALTRADTAFTLAGGTVSVGDYDYTLQQVGPTWYLQSRLRAAPPAVDATPVAVPLDARWMLALTGLLLAAAGARAMRTARRR